jgi:Protein of unknown function (DUF3142)
LSRAKLRAIAGLVGGVALALAAIFWVQAGSGTSLGDDLCLFQLACLGHLGQTEKPLANDAYIWQRKWTPAVSDAINQSSSFVDGWRVLGAETDEDGRVEARSPDWTTLNQSGKPVILVIRIDGQMVHWDEEALLSDVTTVLSQWQKRAKFLIGLEIDHDSATAHLFEYSHFLKRLRAQLDGGLRLSITTLPAWLDSPDLSAVLGPIDEAVLQVHAVQAPQAGLFDRRVAIQWIDRLSAHTSKSFRVALPAYGARVALRENGRVLAVESEVPLMVGGSHFVELTVAPDEVRALLRALERHQPNHLAGVVWFRMPVSGDKRTWSLATLQAVIRGAPLKSRVDVLVEDGDTPGLVTISLINDGDVDAPLPQHLSLPNDCVKADGINGFVLDRDGPHVALVEAQRTVLHEHHRLTIGWARCSLASGDVRVQQ